MKRKHQHNDTNVTRHHETRLEETNWNPHLKGPDASRPQVGRQGENTALLRTRKVKNTAEEEGVTSQLCWVAVGRLPPPNQARLSPGAQTEPSHSRVQTHKTSLDPKIWMNPHPGSVKERTLLANDGWSGSRSHSQLYTDHATGLNRANPGKIPRQRPLQSAV